MIAPKAIEDFLIAVHFGKTDLLTKCLRLAYRDLQRTVRGISKFDKGDIPGRVRDLVVKAQLANTQDDFDAWHQSACEEIIAAFRRIGYQRFTVGHAQKWLNMTMKYLFVLGDRIPSYRHLHQFCHAPLDQFVIQMVVPEGFRPLPGTGAWSALDDYSVYMDRQRWFRQHFDTPPLVTEFRLWLDYVAAASEQPHASL